MKATKLNNDDDGNISCMSSSSSAAAANDRKVLHSSEQNNNFDYIYIYIPCPPRTPREEKGRNHEVSTKKTFLNRGNDTKKNTMYI